MGEVIQDSIVVEAQTENLHKVREFMSRNVQASALGELDRNKVVLAVDEAVANIMRHAYSGAGSGEVQIAVSANEEKFEITIFDSGSVFDPNDVKEPDMMEHVRLGKKSGLGIFLMRQIMDEVTYNFREGSRNRLHLVKFVNPSESKPGPGVS